MSNHPVISNLIEQTKDASSDSKSFYIPLDALLNYDKFEVAKISAINKAEVPPQKPSDRENAKLNSEIKAM